MTQVIDPSSINQTQSAGPDYSGYRGFLLEERNGSPEQEGPHWRITALLKGPEELFSTRSRNAKASLSEAIEGVRERLMRQKANALAIAQGCDEQLARIEERYAAPPSPAEKLSAHRPEIVRALKQWAATKESTSGRLAEMWFSFGYMNKQNLLVVNLPEYDAINAVFRESDIQALSSMLEEAGFTVNTHWNGEGLNTVTFDVR